MYHEVYFSIIIPTYNREELIIECINKIKIQSFKSWECIIINDGSTDNTKESVRLVIKNDSRFKLINQKNAERAISRNNGAKIAKGKYLIFLDSDDYFSENHLISLYHEIKSNGEKEAMYFCNAHIVKNNIEELIHKNKIDVNQINYSFFLNNSVIPARVCIHHKIFEQFQFEPRAIIVEDTILWIEILDNYPVIYIPIDSVFYLLHDNNSVNISVNNAYKQRLIGLKILFNEKGFRKKISKKIRSKHLNRCYLGISEYYYLRKKYFDSFFWIVKSLILFPTIEFKYKIKTILTFKFKFTRSDRTI
jgi:glycosyltransferase involved in cell wall biosynthesis